MQNTGKHKNMEKSKKKKNMQNPKNKRKNGIIFKKKQKKHGK